ncbi:growth-regulating factor 7 isoform X5 [Phaseolus vulgaris]|uniref:growth-regulating factor 7 isoform X5 n=1 Tax=Phaseolus vulgaris TaxID=3885 RepID=UPI0035CC8608
MGEFGLSHTRKRSSSSNNSGGSVVGLDVKLQSPEALFHNKMTMMAHHNHHHRPLSSPFDNDSCAGDGDGPTAYMSFTNHINLVSGASVLAPAIDGGCGAPAPVRTLQPFDISPYTSPTTTSSTFKPSVDGGFNLRLASSTDPEPGRCRRTDGKKWRCSRDVAPNHKYCERHMHRGRPRSRKPVEVNTKTTTPTSINNNSHQIKRPRHESNPFPSIPDVTVAISNPTSRKHGSSPHFLGSSTTPPYLESPLSLANFSLKAANFDSMASVSANKEPRGLEWMLNGDPISLGASDSEWQSLMHNKVGLSSESCCNNTQPQFLNSFALYNTGLDQQNRRHPFLNPLIVPMENLQPEKTRGFIDAWSNTETGENNAATTNNNNKNSAVSIGKLSLSSLDLSKGGGAVNEDLGNVNIGLGLMESIANTHTDTKISLSNWLNPAPWVASTLGGPLAEVLRSSTVTATTKTNEATSNTPSPATTHVESNSPLGTMVSSPSGVLQKTLVSLSDSSSNSSPTVASSRANSEMTLLRFQPNVN